MSIKRCIICNKRVWVDEGDLQICGSVCKVFGEVMNGFGSMCRILREVISGFGRGFDYIFKKLQNSRE